MKSGLYFQPPPVDAEWLERWPNFRPDELSCKCGGAWCRGEYYHDRGSLDALQGARTAVGRPFVITSGHRCFRHNLAVRGAERSAHLKIAFDIALRGHDRHALRAALENAGFKGIGLAVSFIHADLRPTPALWDYGAASRVAWGLAP